MSIVASFLMNLLMTVLLSVTITCCWKLNRRIRQLQDSRGEMAQIIREFNDATVKAQMSISELKTSAKAVSETIQHKIDKAGFLADDLSFMIEKGDKVANHLENNLTGASRSEARMEQRSLSATRPAPAPVAEVAPRREAPPQEPVRAAEKPAQGTRPASLESVLEKIATRNAAKAEGASPSAQPAAQRPLPRLRTQAERELLDALKQVR